MSRKLLLLALVGTSISTPALANDTLKSILIDDAKVGVSFRYRLEHVDQNALPKDSLASTLRSTLNYKTGEYNDISGTLEFQNVLHLLEDNFNDSTNGKTTYPTIADPEITEVNQAFLTYSGLPETEVSLGRKTFNFDNMRFVNKNNWRQHQQSFDSLSLTNTTLPDTTFKYVYIDNINRSNGSDHPLGNIGSNSHLVNTSYNGWEYGSLTGYGYFLDFENSAFAGNSSRTYGARFTGKAPLNENLNLLYTAEYATQSDHGDNTSNYDADYQLGELGLGGDNWNFKLGYEALEADGSNGRFTTPLGTGHGFHGWADQFVSVPSTGIEDKHIKFDYKLNSENFGILDGTKFDFRYHDFDAETGGSDHGTEFDLKLSKSFMEHYSISAIYADYNADNFSSDTQKAWLILGAKF